MGIIEILGLAGSLSLLSGWRFYLTIFATGVAMHFDIVPLPENLQMLDVLANPWVLGISALGAVAEFFADKIAWLNSIWDGLHTMIRPVGGALLALAVVDSSDPTWQVIAFLIRRRRGAGQSRNQSDRKGGGQHQSRTVQQCHCLNGRRRRNRRLACARLRQSRRSFGYCAEPAGAGDMGVVGWLSGVPTGVPEAVSRKG